LLAPITFSLPPTSWLLSSNAEKYVCPPGNLHLIAAAFRFWMALSLKMHLMCGRYTIRTRGKAKFYGVPASAIPLAELPLFGPRYNIAPSQKVPVIVEGADGSEEREVALFQWGLVPSWSKDAAAFINARAETLEQKPSFAESFLRRRCLIPADGFYEWERRGKLRQPWFFQMKDESPFAFAGIWDQWARNGRATTSCAIITTTANELLTTIHDRMPVILDAETQGAWLRSDADIRQLKDLLAPFPADVMKRFPVSSRVNSAQVDDAGMVEPVEPAPETGLLF
jgi:putative SOS response-associated peptidase YedK